MSSNELSVIENPQVEKTHAVTTRSVLDIAPADFSAALDRRSANRKALIEWIRGSLVDGVDFGSVPLRNGKLSKPSLRKSGAEKICGMLGVLATFPSIGRYEQLADENQLPEYLIVKCILLNGDGMVVAEGTGARSLRQDDGDLNKCIKMLSKSAMIDATLRMAGLSEILTQDLEDMPPGAADVQERTPPTPARQTTGQGFATVKQIALIERRLGDAGIDPQDLCDRFQINAVKEVPFARVNEVLAWIQAPTGQPATVEKTGTARPRALDRVVSQGQPRSDEIF